MIKITANDHKYITTSVLKALSQNHITTILDFLSEDAEKLSIITKLPLSQIIDVRNYYFTNYSATIKNGSTLFNQTLTLKKQICTGIDNLDFILSGGIPVGQITEICGLAGSGKSQICMQIAINCARNSENTVLYIDTKGDFSAVHIQKVLSTCGLSYKDMAQIMLKIKIVNIWTMTHLIDLMKDIKDKVIIENLSLIIIDSLPALMFQHFGDDNKIGLTFLNTFVTNCRYLSRKLETAVICVNIETRWVEQDVLGLDDDEDTNDGIKENVYRERRTRSLGKYWQHIPAIVIHVEKKVEVERNNIHVTVKKYNIPEIVIGKCILNINSTGVT